jgi:hypothetical protein
LEILGTEQKKNKKVPAAGDTDSPRSGTAAVLLVLQAEDVARAATETATRVRGEVEPLIFPWNDAVREIEEETHRAMEMLVLARTESAGILNPIHGSAEGGVVVVNRAILLAQQGLEAARAATARADHQLYVVDAAIVSAQVGVDFTIAAQTTTARAVESLFSMAVIMMQRATAASGEAQEAVLAAAQVLDTLRVLAAQARRNSDDASVLSAELSQLLASLQNDTQWELEWDR